MPKYPQPSLEQIAALPKTLEATIPADYLDEMGHMNVMWYTHLYSQAMQELLHSVGIDQQYINQHHAGTFALEKHIRYFAEIRVGEQTAVYSRMLGRVDERFHVLQFMINQSHHRLASTIETVGAHVDLDARRTSPMPSAIAEALDAIVREHQSLDWPPSVCGVMGP